jgi:glucoamylase
VTDDGALMAEVPRHFVRIQPMTFQDPNEVEELGEKTLHLRNIPPAQASTFPAKEIVDAGFLELVRYGVRGPRDPLIVESLRVVDSVLKVDTPGGPCWRRFNHDGYGQAEDGGPYTGVGRGRAWPLLTGERGHYELAAGRDASLYLRTMEQLSTPTGMLPEQVWDAPDIPSAHQFLGRPTESAVPLAWAHAEYIKLARSIEAKQVFDRIPEVADRYVHRVGGPKPLEVWSFRRQPVSVAPGRSLRIIGAAPFLLRWSDNDWTTITETRSVSTGLAFDYVDLTPPTETGRAMKFTFFWTETSRWEGRDFSITVA